MGFKQTSKDREGCRSSDGQGPARGPLGGHVLTMTKSKGFSLLCASATVPSSPRPESRTQHNGSTSWASVFASQRPRLLWSPGPRMEALCRLGIKVLQTANPSKGSHLFHVLRAWVGYPGGTSGKESVCQCRRHERLGFSPWGGKIPWRREWHPPQPSCLEDTRGRGAWSAAIHAAAKSRSLV